MTTAAPLVGARQAMQKLNLEAGKLHIWLRTQANAPAHRPWFRETGFDAGGQIASGRVGAAQIKPVAHHWRWSEISPYLDRIAEIARASDVSPIEFAERQQFLLTNPEARWSSPTYEHDALRRIHLQSGRCRAGPHSHPPMRAERFCPTRAATRRSTANAERARGAT
jgi:hypothetical protein